VEFFAYTIDATSGALTPVAGSPFEGSSNPDGVVDGTGKFVYISDYGSNVFGFTIDATSGALRPVAGSPFATGEGPKDVVVTRSQ